MRPRTERPAFSAFRTYGFLAAAGLALPASFIFVNPHSTILSPVCCACASPCAAAVRKQRRFHPLFILTFYTFYDTGCLSSLLSSSGLRKYALIVSRTNKI